MAKCPNCGNDATHIGDNKYVCQSCGAQFSFEAPSEQNSEIAQLKARIAALEAEKQTPVRQKQQKPVKEKTADSPALVWLKKHWTIPVIILLALITAITLMTCLIGVRGIYVNTEFPNEFYSFTATGFEHHGISSGEEYVDKGSWKIKDNKLYLNYKDNFLGATIDVEEDYYLSKSDGNKKLYIGDSREYMHEFKRISLLDYSVISKKVQVTFKNGVQSDTKRIKIGDAISSPSRPSNNEYEFMGWYDDPYGYKQSDSNRLTGITRVWEDITYYANFNNPTNYEVVISGAISKTFNAKEGDRIFDILQNILNCNFYYSGKLIDENFTMPAQSIEINCVVPDNMFTVLVNGIYNNEVINDTLYATEGGALLPMLNTAYPNGYFFYQDENINEDFIMPSSNIFISIADKRTTFKILISGEIEDTVFISKDVPVLRRLNEYYPECSFYLDDSLIDEDFLMPSHDINVICYKQLPLYNLTIMGAISSTYELAIGTSILSTLNNILSDKVCYYNDERIDETFVMPAKTITIYCFTQQQEQYYTELEKIFYFYETIVSLRQKTISGDVTIPSEFRGREITTIDNSAFYGCSGLTSITIPDSVTTIGASAFYGCSGLMSITIPDSVTTIGYAAFDRCDALEAVYITNIAKWCEIYFYVWVSNPLYYATNLYLNGKLVTDLIIPDGVTSINSYAFYGCGNLTSVTIPNSVMNIGDDAFILDESSNLQYNEYDNAYYIGNDINPYLVLRRSKSDDITSCKISNYTRFIYDSAFSSCDNITSIIIPDSVTSIGKHAFWACNKLTNVTIGNGVTKIGTGAFYGCESLASMTIPDSVMSVGSNAFADTQWYNNQPSGIIYVGKVAYEYKGTMHSNTSITIKNGTTSISDYAFYECDGLTSVTVTDGITNIGNSAFAGCSDLTNATIPDSVTSIGSSAFFECSELTSITFEGTMAQWKSISKGSVWNYSTSNFTIHCTDGDLDKYDREI